MPALQTSLRAARQAFPLVILGGCAVILWPAIATVDMAQLNVSLHAIAIEDWVLALVFTFVSFFAIGQYDVIAHRQLDTGLPVEQARLSGMAAIALSQTVGFGLITATLVRWRMLRGYGAGVAALVTIFVSLTVLSTMIALTALACLVLPTPEHVVPLALGVLIGLLVLLVLVVRHPRLIFRGRTVEFPSLRAVSAATGWAALDVLAACFALWLLIPDLARPDFLAFFPVFCIALCAGLFSGTPAGAGPFELALLMFCATGQPAEVDTSALLAAVLAFRLVYFALPAVLAAAAMLVRPASTALRRDPELPHLEAAPRAETAVIRQNGGAIEQIGGTFAALWPTGQALVAMYDPFETPDPGFFSRLRARAQERNRVALIYKACARTALAARKAGWVCVHGADDAVIDVTRYSLNTPERAGLRRKLRKAGRSGVTIRAMRPDDLPRMAEVDTEWQAQQRGARGGSMGRFCPAYLATQRALVAEADGRIVAFISLQQCAREWALDLMRQANEAPDGTMHALVHAAIEAAGKAGVMQVSLAAVPACPDPESAAWRHIAMRMAGLSKSAGLRQFKSSFAPRWKPLYVAAPSRVALVIATLDIAREVFWPSRLGPRADVDGEHQVNVLHDQGEFYEVASDAAA